MAKFIVVSNRGPYSASESDEGDVQLKRGAGGLVTAIIPLMKKELAQWIFPISSSSDVRANELGLFQQVVPGLHPSVLPVEIHDGAYNKISNEILWYLNHGMFSLSRSPVFDSVFYYHWDQYLQYSALLAKQIAKLSGPNDNILLQDYHMFLVAKILREARPDLELSLFLHTPFATKSEFEVLPTTVASQILESLGSLDHLGFHCDRWRDNYLEVVKSFHITPAKKTWVNPLGSDQKELEHALDEAKDQIQTVSRIAGGRRIIARSDRMEPSKNILRGIDAIVEMFRFYPYLLNSVVHIANCYPSREAILDYQSYSTEVNNKVAASNLYLHELAKTAFIELDRDPIVVFKDDDFHLSIALLSQYDVLLVNPIRDGLNLVATEGPVINSKNGTLVLSANAGVAQYLSNHAMIVNPFDTKETALALFQALSLDQQERDIKSEGVKSKSFEHNPQVWFSNQIEWFDS